MTTAIATSPLDAQSLWAKYKLAVWRKQTPPSNTVHNIMRTLRAVNYGPDGLAYISHPITSGRFLYDLRINRLDLLPSQCVKLAIDHNTHQASKFAQTVAARSPQPVVNPAALSPIFEDWEQDHFQALWLTLIAELCTKVYMSDGWEYSTGGCEEFTHVMQLRLGLPQDPAKNIEFWNNMTESEAVARERMARIEVCDHEGRPISLEEGLDRMTEAYYWIQSYEFTAPRLGHCIDLLTSTRDLLAAGFYQ